MKFVIAFIVVLISPNDSLQPSLQPALIEYDKLFSTSDDCQIFLNEYTKENIFSDYREQLIETEDSLPMQILEPGCFEKDIEKDFIPMLRDFYYIGYGQSETDV